MLDTHEVHSQQKTVKTAPSFVEEDLQENSSDFYHIRHPRGAFVEEDFQESSSDFYHVRHPRGASMEEDLPQNSIYYYAKHQRVHLSKKTVKNVLLYIIKLDTPEVRLPRKTLKNFFLHVIKLPSCDTLVARRSLTPWQTSQCKNRHFAQREWKEITRQLQKKQQK